MAGAVAGLRMAVVGATGFIGSHLTDFLVRGGAKVLAVARSRTRLANIESVATDCLFRECDILGGDSLAGILKEFRPEAVFHLAGDVDAEEDFAQMVRSVEANTIGTVRVLEASARAGAGVLVYADSCKVYGNGPVPYRLAQPEAPVCSYAIAKSAGWQLCRLVSQATGMAVCGLRSTSVYGPRQNPNLITHVRDCVRRGVPVRLLGGSQTRDLLFVDDAVRAFAAAATRPAARGLAIPIGGGRELSVAEICRKIIGLMGSDIEVAAGANPPRLTEVWRTYCDNAEAKDLLEWSPAVSLEQGLSRVLADALPVPERAVAGASAPR
jgi:UDP-glucose 4-epimerase